MDNLKIQNLIEISKGVIRDCSLETGAIIAANSDKNYYPSEAKYYKYVWPRDAMYTCIAADILGIKEIQPAFFKWCIERAQAFKETGLFFENYFPNGLQNRDRFQPDQTGSVLFAIWYHYQKDLKQALKFKELIIKAANGICGVWEKTHFSISTTDLWEERSTFPDLKDNFTYSLAASSQGLMSANKIISNKKWHKVANEMEATIIKNTEHHFIRSFGKIRDNRIDASLLGLVYPFDIVDPNNIKMKNTIKEIEKKLNINGGLYRYEYDEYDGWMYKNNNDNNHYKKGAGAWPLLNFWISLYYSKIGDKNKAQKYYNWVIDRVENYIPEQIFENNIQVGVTPLCWSHAMFIIASKELGYIK